MEQFRFPEKEAACLLPKLVTTESYRDGYFLVVLSAKYNYGLAVKD